MSIVSIAVRCDVYPSTQFVLPTGWYLVAPVYSVFQYVFVHCVHVNILYILTSLLLHCGISFPLSFNDFTLYATNYDPCGHEILIIMFLLCVFLSCDKLELSFH